MKRIPCHLLRRADGVTKRLCTRKACAGALYMRVPDESRPLCCVVLWCVVLCCVENVHTSLRMMRKVLRAIRDDAELDPECINGVKKEDFGKARKPDLPPPINDSPLIYCAGFQNREGGHNYEGGHNSTSRSIMFDYCISSTLEITQRQEISNSKKFPCSTWQ